MMTLFEQVYDDKNYDAALEWYARLRTEVKPEREDAYILLQMCLTAFCFARSFYSDAYARRTQEYDDPRKRVVVMASVAEAFRNTFFRIGEYQLGTTGPKARAQSLIELEACARWLKKKGLRGWLVRKYVAEPQADGTEKAEWVDVEPREFVSTILDAYTDGKKKLKLIQQEIESKREKGHKHD